MLPQERIPEVDTRVCCHRISRNFRVKHSCKCICVAAIIPSLLIINFCFNVTSRRSLTTTTTTVTNAHGARSKDYKRDESAINAQLQWLSTAAGQAYLSELSPAAREMYSDGTLRRILHRPDWPKVAERWKDYAKLSYPVNRQFAEQYLTIHHRQQFFEQGYCVIQDVIHPELLNNARKLALFWAGRYPEDRTDLSSERAGCKLAFTGGK
jgi:hypothetical protein